MKDCGHHPGDAIEQHLDDEEPSEHRSDRSKGVSIDRVGGGEEYNRKISGASATARTASTVDARMAALTTAWNPRSSSSERRS